MSFALSAGRFRIGAAMSSASNHLLVVAGWRALLHPFDATFGCRRDEIVNALFTGITTVLPCSLIVLIATTASGTKS